jgi:SAM-dependent methyltransferase
VKEFGERWRTETKIFNRIFSKYRSEILFRLYRSRNTSLRKIVDIGCGTGILEKLYGQDNRFQKVLGIDINPYPEWDVVRNDKIGGLLEVVWVYLDHFRAPATCRSGLSGAGIPRLAVRMHVAG